MCDAVNAVKPPPPPQWSGAPPQNCNFPQTVLPIATQWREKGGLWLADSTSALHYVFSCFYHTGLFWFCDRHCWKRLLKMDQLEERVCEEVRKYPHLYDPRNPHHKDTTYSSNSWREISMNVGLDTAETVRKWKNARDKFVRQRRDLKSKKSGDPGGKRIPAFQIFMSWLDPFIKHRQTSSTLWRGMTSADPRFKMWYKLKLTASYLRQAHCVHTLLGSITRPLVDEGAKQQTCHRRVRRFSVAEDGSMIAIWNTCSAGVPRGGTKSTRFTTTNLKSHLQCPLQLVFTIISDVSWLVTNYRLLIGYRRWGNHRLSTCCKTWSCIPR